MHIFADLKGLQNYLDLFEKEERAVSVLIQLAQERKSTIPAELVDLHRFCDKELCFLQKEKSRIHQRHRFMEGAVDELRCAEKELMGAMQTATHILLSGNGDWGDGNL